MSRTLVLTTPQMHGTDVGRAQTILNGHNHFDQDYYTGPHDETYGELTAQAAYRAHYWLGFTLADLTAIGHRYGDVLDGLLTGKIELDKKRSALRTIRVKAAGQTPLREKAFAKLLAHLGEKESPPGSNHCYATARWHLVGPWCAMAVSEAYLDAGSKAFILGRDYAYVPYLEAAALTGTRGLSVTLNPQRGDIATFDWEQNGESDHTGLFDEWITRGQTFRTLEGNTSPTSDSDGGEVMRRERSTSEVGFHIAGKPAFIHVGA